MSDLEKQEIIDILREKLVTDSDLAFLGGLPLPVVKEIRAEIDAYIHRTEEAQKPLFNVMAMATKFMPNFIITKIAKDYLTPYVMAQISHYMEPRDAANLGKSFTPDVLAQVALYTEPSLTATIADKMGVNAVSKIVDEMIRHGFFHRLGEVSDVLSLGMLRQLIQRISNEEHLARIAAYMHDLSRLSQVAADLGHRREAVYQGLLKIEAREEVTGIFA